MQEESVADKSPWKFRPLSGHKQQSQGWMLRAEKKRERNFKSEKILQDTTRLHSLEYVLKNSFSFLSFRTNLMQGENCLQ